MVLWYMGLPSHFCNIKLIFLIVIKQNSNYIYHFAVVLTSKASLSNNLNF